MQNNSNLLKALEILLAVKPEKKPTESTEKSSEIRSPATYHIVDTTEESVGKSIIITGVAPPKKSAH
jgi:hypothetical protein